MRDTPTSSLRLGVLISGRGSNLEAILRAIGAGHLAASVEIVISNRPGVRGLDVAQQHTVPRVEVMPRQHHGSRHEQQMAMAKALESAGADLVVLAGFDQVLVPAFVKWFAGRIINIHPSLLPSFAGTMQAVRQAWEHGVKVSGCTVHFVTDEVDSGPIIVQEAVPVMEDDTPETLAARILEHEHQILPRAIALFAAGTLRLEGRRVRVLP